jgi:hypothetical protein
MTQRELNRAVAQATGETVRTIDEIGFVPLLPIPYEHEPLTIDWDEFDSDRNLLTFPRRKRTPVVA